jgi:RNA polymerase sigma factor (TIGR02999 family)
MAEPDEASDRPQEADLDALFLAWRNGQGGAFDALFAALYEQLRLLAHRQLSRSGGGDTLRTTSIVHEAYLRLAGSPQVEVEGREHFFSLAARAMRFVLVDYARMNTADKRGGAALMLTMGAAADVAAASASASAEEVLVVDQALGRLAGLDSRQAQVFELRAFGGLTVEEVADLIGVAPATVKRDWDKARLFVARELAADAPT